MLILQECSRNVKVESGIEQERGGEKVEGKAGGEPKGKKRGDLENRVAFRNK